jgi:hypothetical protein
MLATKQLSIPIGFQWKHNASGKEWVVTGLRPGGVCEIHQVGRFVTGETYTRCIRAQLDDGTSIVMETSDAARKILRRINGRDYGN